MKHKLALIFQLVGVLLFLPGTFRSPGSNLVRPVILKKNHFLIYVKPLFPNNE
jgi:hypothetical protein